MRRKVGLLILVLSFGVVIAGVVLNQWWVLIAGLVVGLLAAGSIASDRILDLRIIRKITHWPGGW